MILLCASKHKQIHVAPRSNKKIDQKKKSPALSTNSQSIKTRLKMSLLTKTRRKKKKKKKKGESHAASAQIS